LWHRPARNVGGELVPGEERRGIRESRGKKEGTERRESHYMLNSTIRGRINRQPLMEEKEGPVDADASSSRRRKG